MSEVSAHSTERCFHVQHFSVTLRSNLTRLRGSGFDLDGRAAPAVLLHLRHPLAGHLVGVVGGAHGDLVLDAALALQLLAAVAVERGEKNNNKK